MKLPCGMTNGKGSGTRDLGKGSTGRDFGKLTNTVGECLMGEVGEPCLWFFAKGCGGQALLPFLPHDKLTRGDLQFREWKNLRKDDASQGAVFED